MGKIEDKSHSDKLDLCLASDWEAYIHRICTPMLLLTAINISRKYDVISDNQRVLVMCWERDKVWLCVELETCGLGIEERELGETICTSTERAGKFPYRLSSWPKLPWMISFPTQKSSSWSFVSPSSEWCWHWSYEEEREQCIVEESTEIGMPRWRIGDHF